MIGRLVRLVALNAVVVVVLAGLALAALETWLRLSIPASSGGSIYEYTLETRRYKRMKPNAAVVAWGQELRTNDLGFRGDAPSIAPKRPGEFRIVVLGDSFTVSAGVAYDRIYTSLVEDTLRQSFPDVSVINLAVGGYNVVQYALVLEEIGLGLQPDMIVVALFPENDFSMDTYHVNHRVASGQESAEPEERGYQALYVYRAYLGRAHAKLQGWFGEKRAQPSAGSATGWEENLAALRSIAEIAKGRNIPLAVAVLPSTWDFDKQKAVFERVEGHCRQQGISCLNLLEPFIKANVSGASLRLNALDAHPNDNYNALVARHLAPYLAERYSALREPNGGQVRRAAFQ